jgi:hypothetical protein
MNLSNSGSAGLATAQEVTVQERAQCHLYLKQTQDCLAGAIKSLSPAQWTHAPGPEQWSISLIVDHIVFVMERVSGPLRQVIGQAPAPPANRDYKLIDSMIINQFPNRLTKFPVPEFAIPVGRFASPSEALGAASKAYAALRDFLDSTPDLREHALEAAPLKAVSAGAHTMMDGYQWILAAAAHTERHTKQILEVKADENLPA